MKTHVYDSILMELDSGERNAIATQIFSLLQAFPGGLSRKDLVLRIFGRLPQANINNDTGDRKIRATISAMRARLIPIVSTSGESGYRLDDSAEARKEMLAEMIKRRTSIDEQIKAASKVWEIPVKYVDEGTATQVRLL